MKSFLRISVVWLQRWAAVLLAGAALGLVIPASASAAAFTAHLSAPNHTPTANKNWPITVAAARGRTKLGGSVRYQFFYQGQRVGSRPGHSFKNGVYRDSLRFPGEAIGQSLTLRVIVSTRYGTVDLNWAVKTRR